jgi:hypothetical protein
MTLSFRNAYNTTAYVGVVLLDRGCGGNRWRKIGWYGLVPGQSVLVVGDRNLPLTKFAWYADIGADGSCWSGTLWYRVPHNAGFNQCFDDNSGCDAMSAFQPGSYGGPSWPNLTVVLRGPDESPFGPASFLPNRESQGFYTSEYSS